MKRCVRVRHPSKKDDFWHFKLLLCCYSAVSQLYSDMLVVTNGWCVQKLLSVQWGASILWPACTPLRNKRNRSIFFLLDPPRPSVVAFSRVPENIHEPAMYDSYWSQVIELHRILFSFNHGEPCHTAVHSSTKKCLIKVPKISTAAPSSSRPNGERITHFGWSLLKLWHFECVDKKRLILLATFRFNYLLLNLFNKKTANIVGHSEYQLV